MPTDFGHFDMYGFTTDYSEEEIVAIVKGDLKSNPNVRMHSACLTGDIFIVKDVIGRNLKRQ